MSNSVSKKIVYYLTVKFVSPLCISQGDGVLTDNDVLTNGEGVPYVPGTSLAGAMRAYIEKKKCDDCLFGFEDMKSKNGKMSSLFVSDLQFSNKPVITVRDSVALSEKKSAITGAKFDMEVIDTGAEGYFWLELVVRQNDDEEILLGQLNQIFSGFNEREIRFGSKKTRGYGEISILDIKQKVFDKTNILEYKDAYCQASQHDDSWLVYGPEKLDYDMSKYVSISVPLKLEGGISIRRYAVKKGEPDFVHITANGKPVIPGTSFTGAIRHRLKNMLDDLQAENSEEILDTIFGYVKPNGANSKAHISGVTVGECVLENAKKLTMVRNGISRFESGAKDGALFKELSYVGGTTELKIKVKKNDFSDEAVGLLLLVLKDVQNGFLAVGGQTSVGRGLFSANGKIIINADKTEEQYLQAAYVALRRK